MASSMTGLGTAEIQFNNTTIIAELKSFNNRYLELSCRLAAPLVQYEREIRDLVRQHLQRGKLYINIAMQNNHENGVGLRVNTEKVKAIHQLLRQVQKTAGTREKLKLEHYLKFSEILESSAVSEPDEALWLAVEELLNKALFNLKRMRDQEGAILARDLIQRIRFMEQQVGAIETLVKDRMPEVMQKLRERLKQLLQETDIDENRVLLEIALLTDRMDVTEECVRLKSHAELFIDTVERESAVGKKLTFLLQEMNREVNTICAKASHAEISHLAVAMKDEIEKLREQVQNLE
jgi:uncharacterized protein (TIGR00255 family)